MTPLGRGCLGVVLLPIAGLVALAGIAVMTAATTAASGLGWTLVACAVVTAASALRLVDRGLRQTVQIGTPISSPTVATRVRSAGPALLAYALVLAAGTAASLAGADGLAVLVPLHVLAALLPARILTRHAGWRQGDVPARLIGRGLAWGGIGATAVAFAAELIMGTAFALVVWLALGATPGAREAVQDVVVGLFATLTAARQATPDSIEALPLAPLLRPSIVVASVGLLGLVGPLVEELAKLAGVTALRPRSHAHAFLAGVSVGAGFGVLEALLTGMASLGPAWGLAIVARGAATLMHATASGIAAIGWYRLSRGEPWPGVSRIGLAVALHAVWNLGVVGAVLSMVADAEGVGPAWLEQLALASPLAVTAVFAFVLFAFTGIARGTGSAAPSAQPPAGSAGR